MTIKLGDRVRVYGAVAPKDGGSVKYAEGEKGRVVSIAPDGSLGIFMDLPVDTSPCSSPNSINEIHPRQCRLLKQKAPKKSIWINPEYLATADDCSPSNCTNVHSVVTQTESSSWIEFVEKRSQKAK